MTPVEAPECISEPNVIPLSTFIADFGDGLLDAVSRQNPPVYDGTPDPRREAVMEALKRRPFPAQQEVVQAVTALLINRGEQAAIINAEMGTGKTMMAIAAAAVIHNEGYHRTLVISPPHLVYKWRREILETVDSARVWVLNGPDTLRKLVRLRALLEETSGHAGPEFFILGRVRMRMGFHWQPAVVARKRHHRRHVEEGNDLSPTFIQSNAHAACPQCGVVVVDEEGEPIPFATYPADKRYACKQCGEALWTLTHPRAKPKSRQDLVNDALCQIPTIGPKTASRLTEAFGEDLLSGMLADNVYEFINLMDEEGELVFSDKQARRMEHAMGNMEFSFGQGGYQPTEYIKRYLPDGYFDLLVVDEGHEYKVRHEVA
ncbi:MAG: DEAD/DEAH box helicase family protein [Gammaproteobacteria bacterium]|nr:DEAD/DEAH box helicase family protein [Gammaproteobacteria bacterium]